MRTQGQLDDPRSALDSLWKDGVTPWDLGAPTKALISEVKSKLQLEHMRTAFVPACGSGYDLIPLARYIDTAREKIGLSSTEESFRVIGLEISPKSIEIATAVLEESFIEEGITKTPVCLYHGDAFACPSTWELAYSSTSHITGNMPLGLGLNGNSKFDFIFDYLFFCALPPESRKSWGNQMVRLLKKDGLLLTLMFPYVTKSLKEQTRPLQGPPYPVSLQDYQGALGPCGLQLDPHCPYTSDDTVPTREGQEMVSWWSHKEKELPQQMEQNV